MPASPIYAPINTNEIESGDPITVSLGLRWAFNYLSVIQGSPTAKAAGLGVWIEKSPSETAYPAPDSQTGILTDCVDTAARLAPDGFGGVKWTTSGIRGMLIKHPTGGMAEVEKSFSDMTSEEFLPYFNDPYYITPFASRKLVTNKPAAILRLSFVGFINVIDNRGGEKNIIIIRYRGVTQTTLIASNPFYIDENTTHPMGLAVWDSEHQDGDKYAVLLQSTNDGCFLTGSLEVTTL